MMTTNDEVFCDTRQDQVRFLQRQVHAKAQVVATAERNVGIPRMFLARCKTERIELNRVRPEIRMSLDREWTHKHKYVFWHVTAVYLGRGCCLACDVPDWRIQAHRFL